MMHLSKNVVALLEEGLFHDNVGAAAVNPSRHKRDRNSGCAAEGHHPLKSESDCV